MPAPGIIDVEAAACGRPIRQDRLQGTAVQMRAKSRFGRVNNARPGQAERNGSVAGIDRQRAGCRNGALTAVALKLPVINLVVAQADTDAAMVSQVLRIIRRTKAI